MLRYRYVIILYTLISFISCNQSNDVEQYPNTPTSGIVKVEADNTFQYIISPQIELFTSIYTHTKVHYSFKGEQECINDLLNDSCKIIFISRKLSEKEEAVFRHQNIIVHQTPIAISAIALIGKPFRNKGIHLDTLKKILRYSNRYTILFFKKGNGTLLFCKDTLLNGENFGKHCFVVEDSTEFRQYILNDKSYSSVIGIIDYSYICDNDHAWSRMLKYPHLDTMLIPIRKNNETAAYYPDQTNLATKDYPLTRVIYCIRRGDNFSLSAGIEAFVAGEKGQVLFKKLGLVPIIDRERKIELKPY